MGTLHVRNVFLIYLYIGQILGNTCHPGHFGDTCQYNCHCKNQNDCTADQIRCQECVSAYSGDTCQIKNIALGKHAVQSSDLSWNGAIFIASLVVDGKTSGRFNDMGCSHTNDIGINWWYVDLGTTYRIRYLKIYNRHEDYREGWGIPGRIKGFRIYISRNKPNIPNWDDRELCYKDTDSHGRKTYDIPCTEVMAGRFVGITLPKSGSLTLCEVEVYACDVGWYGRKCNKECSKRNCNSDADPCDITNGKCGTQGCTQGWEGYDCTCPVGCDKCDSQLQICSSCPYGLYGTRCNFSCDARRCLHRSSCPINGDCWSSKCESGWTGKDCTCPLNCMSGHCDKHNTSCSICQDNWYGLHCNMDCNERHCLYSSSTCPISGACDNDRCDSGWKPPNCTCPENCLAGECDSEKQTCNACETDWYGALCNKRCDDRNCEDSQASCLIDGYCSTCRSGYYGIDCTKSCPPNCDNCHKDRGNCLSCNMRFYDTGESCAKKCSDRQCSNVKSTCPSDGLCDGDCREGWYRRDCTEKCKYSNCKKCERRDGSCEICKDGFWARRCDRTCPNDCKTCDKTRGGCESCHTGKYNLNSECNKRCRDRKCKSGTDACDDSNGKCDSGCRLGYYGTDCSRECATRCEECEQSSGACTRCKQSWYGISGTPVCSKKCGERKCKDSADICPNDGHCRNGCHDGWYGTDCTKQCKLVNCAKCEQNTGTCTVCKVGKYGPLCESNCEDRLCKDSTSCDRSGTCTNGCQDGWYQSDCTQQCPKCKKCDINSGLCTKCDEGKYGSECDIECERRNCHNKNDPCPIDGACQSGCETGYSGRGCAFSCRALNMDQECIECTDYVCTKCDGANYPFRKQCLSCQSKCKACHNWYECGACVAGSYGTDCNLDCSANCEVINTTKPVCDKDTGFCSDGCSIGYYGDQCDEHCPIDCLNHTCSQKRGKCILGCRDKYFGDKCHQQCVNCKHDTCIQESGECTIACIEGKFGRFCNETCVNECVSDNEIKCERNTGHCLHCIPGRYGLSCDKFCNKACETNQTGKSECDQESGTCLIGCIKGFHGASCEKNCSRTCNEDECDQHTAKCAFGCIDGWSGPTCESEESGNTGLIIGIVLGLIIILILVGVVAFFAVKKYKKPQRETNAKKVVEGSKIKADKDRNIELKSSVYENTKPGTSGDIMIENDGLTYCNQMPIKTSPTAIVVGNLWQYTQTMKSNGELERQYRELPSGMVLPHNDAMIPENKAKNRYKGIYAYDHSRVKLNVTPGSSETDYINACYIDGYQKPKQYIASQGPTELILNDFWRMIWDVKASKAVMLTNLVENKKQKCEMYWPPEVSETRQFGKISVTLVKEDTFADFTIRILHVKKFFDRQGHIEFSDRCIDCGRPRAWREPLSNEEHLRLCSIIPGDGTTHYMAKARIAHRK